MYRETIDVRKLKKYGKGIPDERRNDRELVLRLSRYVTWERKWLTIYKNVLVVTLAVAGIVGFGISVLCDALGWRTMSVLISAMVAFFVLVIGIRSLKRMSRKLNRRYATLAYELLEDSIYLQTVLKELAQQRERTEEPVMSQ